MTTPKSLKSIPTRLRIAAQDAILTGIVGEATKAIMAGNEPLGDAIRQIGASMADKWKAELPAEPAPAKPAIHAVKP